MRRYLIYAEVPEDYVPDLDFLDRALESVGVMRLDDAWSIQPGDPIRVGREWRRIRSIDLRTGDIETLSDEEWENAVPHHG